MATRLTQGGDVKLFQTSDDGDIEVLEGLFTMTPGLDNASYLSMFGGNEDDDGGDGNIYEWWGNLLETEDAYKYRSETQYVLENIPATLKNLNRLKKAIERDHAPLIAAGVADSVAVTIVMVEPKVVSVTVTLTAEGEAQDFKYSLNWKASV